MFLIGAPLGAIIRKGGLGVPVLISIIFFIIFYLLTYNGEKAAKEGQLEIPLGMIGGHAILLSIGVFFLVQAWNDNSLFDADFYISLIKKLRGKNAEETTERVISTLDDLKPEDLK
ncbi:MAG: hypothetical protein DDT42_01877 [candidate division WS2 bacterium]|uniref:Uncharacterized protein n=1 Tax=Psychracetigena formicireducens TaxID=2986056 RepID=A0A9E2BI63_PSYF1|nr:hypothetical protein [Candidatus Psychracetigena formicireducens]